MSTVLGQLFLTFDAVATFKAGTELFLSPDHSIVPAIAQFRQSAAMMLIGLGLTQNSTLTS